MSEEMTDPDHIVKEWLASIRPLDHEYIINLPEERVKALADDAYAAGRADALEAAAKVADRVISFGGDMPLAAAEGQLKQFSRTHIAKIAATLASERIAAAIRKLAKEQAVRK